MACAVLSVQSWACCDENQPRNHLNRAECSETSISPDAKQRKLVNEPKARGEGILIVR